METGKRVKIKHLNKIGLVVKLFEKWDHREETQYLIKLDIPLFTTDGILIEYLVSSKPYLEIL